MRRVATAIAKSWAGITRALAYYPLGFYLGLLLIVAAAFLYWAQTDLGWKFDWVQLQRWISNHAMAILALFTGLLGLVLIGSAIAYKQVIDLSKQEYVLWLHQRATKVLFPVFSPLHDWIRLRSRIYHWWHAQSFSNVTHYFLLVIAIGGLAKTTFNYISSAQASHGCSDAVTITVNTTWSTNQCHGDVVIRNGATLTINGGVTADLSSLSVGSDSPAENGFITAKGDTLNNLGVVLNIDGNVYIRSGSSISGDGQGFTGGATGGGNGNGPGGGTGSATAHGGGGGHGAVGGAHTGGSDGPGGTAYGTFDGPIALGSGGGGANGAGTNGASAIKINATNSTVTISGTISFNGDTTTCGAGATAPGGGSGGSVWIVANTLAGSGTVRANGGRCTTYTDTPGGAGGRIFISATNDSSSLTKQAYGGSGLSGTTHRGGAGTIVHNNALAVVNDSVNSTGISPSTPFTGSSYSFISTTVSYASTIELGAATSFSGGALTINNGTNTFNIPQNISSEPTFSSINIASGGTLRHPANSSTHSYSLILASTGAVTVTGNVTLDGLGYTGGGVNTAGNGPGGGLGSGTGCGGSGAHVGNGQGGVGVCGSGGANGGTAYGTVSAPTTPGSGGGGGSGSSGGAGGGVLKINAPTATVTVNGTISSNGSAGGGGAGSGGGGAGGSIWIRSSTFTGTGTLRANAGGSCGFACTSGSGGMIRVEASSDTSSLIALQAEGGQGTTNHGAAGIAWRANYLQVANNSANAVLSPITPISESSYTFTSSLINYRANVEIGSSTTINTGATTIQNNSKVSLAGANTVWTGSTLIVQAGTNTINVPPTITTKPLFGSITVNNTLTHDTNSSTYTKSLILQATGDIIIASGGSITAQSKGYSATNGDGAGQSGTHGAGAGHGSAGGNGSSGQIGGSAYGSALQPTTPGSGGGNGANGAGSAGGGYIQLSSGGTLTVTGSIIASADNASAGCCGNGPGGGSGGGIWISATTITGSGPITAAGGNGTGGGGCGGGGRVSRHYQTSTYSGTVSVAGGSGCGAGTNQTVGAVTDLVVSGISTPRTAGTVSSIVVEARDGSNNRNYAYTKTVVFTSSDSQADSPSNYAFTIANAGQATIAGVILKTAGTQTVTVDQLDDGSVDGIHSNITVSPSSATLLTVAGIDDPITAGTANTVTVTAKDPYNNTATGYTGTVAFTSNDSFATLPNNYTFVGGDAGIKSFTNGVTLKTAGERSVTATDTVTSSITGTQANITVNPAVISTLNFTGIATPTTVGVAHSPVVTAKDAYNNTVTSYTGTIAFSSSDAAATIPTNYTFVGSDAGVKTFTNGVVLKTTGVHSITASDGTITGTIQNINVTAGQPTKLKVSNITSPIAANTPASPTVTVQDQYNNTATGYTGTITFSSSDAAATLPSNYAFSVSDQGVRTFTNGVIFATGGTHSLTVTDVSSPTINGTLSSIVVTAAASAGGTSQPGVTNQPSLTIVLIQPSEGTFFGTITQEVNGLPLEVTVSGTVKGNQINGTVSGTYNEQPVTGTITGTVKGQKIESAILTLFNANDPGFNLTVVVGGVISPPDSPKQEPDCKLRGTLELTIDGKKFSGDVQLTISPDGSVTGRAKGFLDNDRVFGTFSASSVEGRLIGGTVTLTSNNNNSPISGEIIGSVRDGEIQLTNAEHCNLSTDVVIDTDEDGDADGEGTGNVEIDEPVSSNDVINGSIIGTVEGQTANEDVIVNGLFEALVSDVVIKPTELKFETNEQNDLISGALAVVSGLSVLPILPAVQNILLTSSTRGFTFIHWFFFGYTPRKRRKFWGVIKDKTTGVPVAGVLVKLVDVHNDRVINQYRTDKTGRYGFLVETVGDYRITIIDPLYAAFSSKEFSVDNLKQPIVTGDIQLTPVHQRQLRLLNKTFVWVAAIKILNVIHWPLLIGGTILSVMLVADHPTTLRTLIASLYSVLWLSKLLGYRRERHYGQVTDTEGAPLARAVVQLTNQSGETMAHIHSTVTDVKGRFVLLVKPGVYTVIVAKDGYKTRQGAVIADEANMTIRLERVDS